MRMLGLWVVVFAVACFGKNDDDDDDDDCDDSGVECSSELPDWGMGGSEAWKNADQPDATCPKCEAHRAYYQQLQIRSADAPMTTFYRCVSCGHNWREDG